MTFLDFKNDFFDLACFSIYQVFARYPTFDRNNLSRWVKKKYLIRLRQGYYAFSEYRKKTDYAFYFANRIYRPSYISLHTALAFYGMIPEAVVQITSVTSLKTTSFKNDFGEYSYYSLKADLMFGYNLRAMADGRNVQFASPEKALTDLLYLNPFYNTPEAMEDLRIDSDYFNEALNLKLLLEYSMRMNNKALDQRLQLLLKTYKL